MILLVFDLIYQAYMYILSKVARSKHVEYRHLFVSFSIQNARRLIVHIIHFHSVVSLSTRLQVENEHGRLSCHDQLEVDLEIGHQVGSGLLDERILRDRA